MNNLKLIIAGSRTLNTPGLVEAAVSEAGLVPTEVVSGLAVGIDNQGCEWALSKGLDVKGFAADWDSHGKRAGFVRNEEMANYGDALVAIWNGYSKGTADMINQAVKRGLPTFIFVVNETEVASAAS